MMESKSENRINLFMKSLSTAVIAFNILFVLWILYNGINENFNGTLIEKFSYIILMGLMILNAILVFRNRKNP